MYGIKDSQKIIQLKWSVCKKSAFAIILGQNYISYENSLCILNMETLSNRREALALKLLIKAWNTPTIVPGLKPRVRLLIQEQLKYHSNLQSQELTD